MATPALMAACNHYHQTTNAGATATLPPLHHQDQPIRRTSGRRKSKGGGCDSSSYSAGQKKKQPQRGMGVEKLERLRLQEGLRKLQSETNIQGFNINTQPAFADPMMVNTSVPVQLSKIGGVTFDPQIGFGPTQQVGYLRFPGQMLAGGLVCDHRHKVSCFGSMDFVGKNVSTTVASGIPKELPFTPNVAKCFSENCNICHKKKKVTVEDMGRPDMYPQMCKFGSECGFLGLNLSDNQNVISQENGEGFEAKPPLPPQLGFALGNGNQGGEVVAVHRKGSSSSSTTGRSEGGKVVMEYEFFPLGCCRNNDELQLELELRRQQLIGALEYQTCSSSSSSISSSMATAAGIFDASTCIDLSLKLSY